MTRNSKISPLHEAALLIPRIIIPRRQETRLIRRHVSKGGKKMNVHFRLPREPSIARTTLKMHAGCVTRDEIRGSANFGNESKRASSQPRVCSKFQSLRGEMLSDVNVWRVRREREQRSVLSFDRFSKRSIDDIARASESSSLLDLYSINAIILPDENPNILRTKNFYARNGVNFIWRGRTALFSPCTPLLALER